MIGEQNRMNVYFSTYSERVEEMKFEDMPAQIQQQMRGGFDHTDDGRTLRFFRTLKKKTRQFTWLALIG